MSAITSRSSTHYLRLGPTVPPHAPALALVTVPPPLPANTLRLAQVAQGSIAGRPAASADGQGGRNYSTLQTLYDLAGTDTTSYGCLPIELIDVLTLPGNVWIPRVRPGSFYLRENRVDTDTESYPDWMPLDWNHDTVLWFYSVPEYLNQRLNPLDDFVAKAGWGPTVQHPADLAEQVSPRQFRLHYTPLVASQTIRLWVAGRPYEGAITIIDRDAGLIQTSTSMGSGQEVVAAYSYEEQNYVFRGYYDAAGEGYLTLDLNPTTGHFCGALGSSPLVPTYDLLVAPSAGTATGIELYAVPTAAYNVTAPAWANSTDGQALRWSPVQWGSYQATRHFQTLGSGHLGQLYLGNLYDPTEVSDLAQAHDQAGAVVPKGIVFSRIYAFPASLSEELAITDVRASGGGLAEDVDPTRWPEARYYFDLPGIEGPAIAENGLLIFRVPRAAYDTYGDSRVRKEIERHNASGVAYILELI